jgi:hypothetical protein
MRVTGQSPGYKLQVNSGHWAVPHSAMRLCEHTETATVIASVFGEAIPDSQPWGLLRTKRSQ